MVDASELFFKADAAFQECKIRRDELQARAQREIAQNLLRFSVLTDELNKLLAERKIARAKANEASCYHIDSGPADCSQLVSTLRDSSKFSDEQL